MSPTVVATWVAPPANTASTRPRQVQDAGEEVPPLPGEHRPPTCTPPPAASCPRRTAAGPGASSSGRHAGQRSCHTSTRSAAHRVRAWPDARSRSVARRSCGRRSTRWSKRGFAHTRVADVAAALGISTGLVFYHFESKDALLSAAFAYAAERDLERLDKAAQRQGQRAAPAGPDPHDVRPGGHRRRLAAVDRRLGDRAAQPRDGRGVPAARRAVEGHRGRGDRRRASSAASCTCDDPSGAAWRITAMLDGLAVQATVHAGVVSRRQVTTWVRSAAAAELGIDPSALRAYAALTPTSSPGGRPRPAPAGRPRTRRCRWSSRRRAPGRPAPGRRSART